MGSILSKIDDDMDEYSYLCEKYNEKEQKLYGVHHDWLISKHRGLTDLDFQEFSLVKERMRLERELVEKQEQILKAERDRDELMRKLVGLDNKCQDCGCYDGIHKSDCKAIRI